jgi:phosphoribosyl-AMP cyclohydrolase
MNELPPLTLDNQGLIPLIVQAANMGEVLMFASATKEALEKR